MVTPGDSGCQPPTARSRAFRYEKGAIASGTDDARASCAANAHSMRVSCRAARTAWDKHSFCSVERSSSRIPRSCRRQHDGRRVVSKRPVLLAGALQTSTDLDAFHPQQCSELLELPGDVPYTHGTVMSRTVGVPLVHEIPGADRKAITAIGVADLENRPGHGLTFCRQQLQLTLCGLHHREQRNRAMLHGHLHRKAHAHFAVLNLQRTHL